MSKNKLFFIFLLYSSLVNGGSFESQEFKYILKQKLIYAVSFNMSCFLYKECCYSLAQKDIDRTLILGFAALKTYQFAKKKIPLFHVGSSNTNFQQKLQITTLSSLYIGWEIYKCLK